MHLIITQMVSQDVQKCPKWGPNRYLKSSNSLKSKQKMKSNDNITIYYTLDRLGHHKSADLPFKHRRKSRLQSKHVFWCFKWQKISKSDPKSCPKGYPKWIKNHKKSVLGPSRVHLCASVTHLIAKWCPSTSKRTQNGHLGTLKGAKNSTESNNQVYNKQMYIFLFSYCFRS